MAQKNTKLLLITTAIAACVLATACTKKQPESGNRSEPVVFKAQAPVPVKLTLQKAEGQTGRTGPISSNYRPQVRFPSKTEELTCKVELPASTPALEPGQTSDASFTCESEVRVEPGKGEFTVFEGGKQVGSGVVQLP